MLRSLEIRGVGPADEMTFEFGERLNLFTGDNGVGKSFVLDVVWWALTACWAGLPAKPTKDGLASIDVAVTGGRGHAEFSHAAQAWKYPQLRALGPHGPVVYAGIDGFWVFDAYRNVLAHPMGTEPRPANVLDAYRFGVHEVWNGLDHQGKPVCNGLIRDWATWMRSQPPNGAADELVPFRLLRRVLEILSDPDEPLEPGPVRPVFVDDPRDIPTLLSPWGGEPIPVLLTSAGVRRILMLAYLLTWTWHEHKRVAMIRQFVPQRQMYVILDELEMHLHPRWQRRIGPPSWGLRMPSIPT